MMQRVLVLENYRQTLAVIRSLQRAGHEVHVGIPTQAPGVYDRAVAASNAHVRCWEHPDFASSRFPDLLKDYCRTHRIDAIFPVGEVTVSCLQAMADDLPPVVAASRSSLEQCLDKSRTGQLAEQAGLPTPTTLRATSLNALDDAVQRLGRPCVIKPEDGVDTLFGRKAWILQQDTPPPSRLFPQPPAHPVLIQPYIEGHRHNCMFLARDARVSAYFECQVMRTDQPDGTGFGTWVRAVPPDPERHGWVESLVRQLGYDGPGCVQFLVGNGESQFLECNPRLDATVALAVHCGVDLPRLALEAGSTGDAARETSYNTWSGYAENQRLHWWLGDVEGGLQSLASGRCGLSDLLIWQARAMADALAADCATVGSWRDPRPGLLVGRHLAGAAIRRLVRPSRPSLQAASRRSASERSR